MTHLERDDSFDWELLVVDNNSTDQTPDVLAEFAGQLPLRALREPKPRKSNATNLVVKEARGEYILWTDDDVLVEPDLRQYITAFRRYPNAEVFWGGGLMKIRASRLVNCAGLQSDRVARLAGLQPGVRIVPFRGEYYVLRAERAISFAA